MKSGKFKDKFKLFFKKLGILVDKTLFPTNFRCIFCDNDIPDYENKPFCESCEKEVEFNNGNKCLICSAPIENEATICDFCQKEKPNYKKAFCPFVYSGKVRSAVLGYKDSNKRYLAQVFAKYIAKEILGSGIKIDIITYVPLSEKKRRKRGFDQAELLAEELGKLLGIVVKRLFVKNKDAKTQKFSNYKERQENMRGMYSLLGERLKKTDTILIVDDVITTGATVNYCAGLCKKKVKDVYVCSIARNRYKEKADES